MAALPLQLPPAAIQPRWYRHRAPFREKNQQDNDRVCPVAHGQGCLQFSLLERESMTSLPRFLERPYFLLSPCLVTQPSHHSISFWNPSRTSSSLLLLLWIYCRPGAVTMALLHLSGHASICCSIHQDSVNCSSQTPTQTSLGTKTQSTGSWN